VHAMVEKDREINYSESSTTMLWEAR